MLLKAKQLESDKCLSVRHKPAFRMGHDVGWGLFHPASHARRAVGKVRDRAWPVRPAPVIRLMGFVALGLALSLCLPLAIALFDSDKGLVPLLLGTSITAAFGLAATIGLRRNRSELNSREALLLVSTVWLGAGIAGGLPFFFSDNFHSFTDAVFECVSGFTTTGASILTNIEAVPASLLFWRSFTHWLGGLGIILLMLAVLPIVGSGGIALYKAEFSGAKSERVRPRLAHTAAALWKVYVVFTVLGILALLAAGLSPLDASCQTFGAIGTGGFSTKNTSIEAFGSPLVEFILIILMVVGGINFARHYQLVVQRNWRAFFQDSEIRLYLFFLGAATFLVLLSLHFVMAVGILRSLRLASFQVVSIMTATGFSSANFNTWTPFVHFLLLTLMFIGGCTGSTAGGLKVSRIALLSKVIGRELRHSARPRAVVPVRLNGQAVQDRAVQPVLAFVCLAILTNLAASALLCATGLDIISAVSGVTSCMFNVGPGLGSVGPASNYGHLTMLAKWVLIFTMIAGRLEFFSFYVIFSKFLWQQ